MDLYILFGQRVERYAGEYSPEPLLCWSEYDVDENEDGFEKACEEERAKHGKEFAAFQVIKVAVSQSKIRQLLLEAPTISGKVKVDEQG